MTEDEQKLTLNEYHNLGKAINLSMKELKLIQKLLTKIGYDDVLDCIDEPFVSHLGSVIADLSNLATEFEKKLDAEHPDKILFTIDYFN